MTASRPYLIPNLLLVSDMGRVLLFAALVSLPPFTDSLTLGAWTGGVS